MDSVQDRTHTGNGLTVDRRGGAGCGVKRPRLLPGNQLRRERSAFSARAAKRFGSLDSAGRREGERPAGVPQDRGRISTFGLDNVLAG